MDCRETVEVLSANWFAKISNYPKTAKQFFLIFLVKKKKVFIFAND